MWGQFCTLTPLPLLPLRKTHLDMLNKFHMKNLRNFQSLPSRTSKRTTLLLIGALPLEGEIHRRQLSFLHNILACNNTTIQDLTERQLVMNIDNLLSFFCITSQLLHQYELPDINTLAKISRKNYLGNTLWGKQCTNIGSKYYWKILKISLL